MTEQHESLRGGRYVVLRTLGEGSQGTTLEAVDKRDGRLVAIKRFDVRGAKTWKDVELAEREAKVLASLSHPSLPAYIEHFEEEGTLFLVMEKIEGESVGAVLRRGERFSEAEVTKLLLDASVALEYLHARAIVHRDLKPSNVIRRPDGTFAFVDFGAVRDRMKREGGSTVVGTFGYMAPEQFQGRALPGSDVYAVGATALAMLTGKEPEALPHRGLSIDVSAALGGSVARAMVETLGALVEPDPDRRPSSLRPLAERLARLSRDRAPSPSSPPAPRSRDTRSPETAPPSRHGRSKEERARRRQLRRARRGEKRDDHGVGFLPALIFAIGLFAARLVVGAVFFVALPILLAVLALFFGQAMRDVSKRVTRVGERATEAIARAHRTLRGAPDDERIRVSAADEDDVRVRVGGAEGAAQEAAHAEEEASATPEDEPARRRRRG